MGQGVPPPPERRIFSRSSRTHTAPPAFESHSAILAPRKHPRSRGLLTNCSRLAYQRRRDPMSHNGAALPLVRSSCRDLIAMHRASHDSRPRGAQADRPLATRGYRARWVAGVDPPKAQPPVSLVPFSEDMVSRR